jgi:hypothetical protein
MRNLDGCGKGHSSSFIKKYFNIFLLYTNIFDTVNYVQRYIQLPLQAPTLKDNDFIKSVKFN